MTRLLLRLYPADWRDRYADEFQVLLEERQLGPYDVADVLLGALDAHLHLRGLSTATHFGRGFAMSLRIGGYAAVLGGILWFTGFMVSSLHLADENHAGQLISLAGTLALLVALAGLSALQSRRYPRAIWVAFAIPALGTLWSIIGLLAMQIVGEEPFLGDIDGWGAWFTGTLALVAGSGIFAFVSWRSGLLSRVGLGLLGFAMVLLLVLLFPAWTGLIPAGEGVAIAATLVLLIAFAAGWVVLGVGVVRADPVPTAGLS